MKTTPQRVIALWGLFAASHSLFGQNWMPETNAPSHNWSCVASSADGKKLLAVNDDMYFDGDNYIFDGSIYTSTNSGASWREATNAPLAGWISCASSADGMKLAALVDGNPIYTSTNGGTTWKPIKTPGSQLNCIACSADGTKLAAGAWDDYVPDPSLIYTSTDSGATWSTNRAPSEYWTSVASSENGRILVATAATGPIYNSFDSGAHWSQSGAPGTNYWSAVASSANGVKLVAAASGGPVYTSINSGSNWTATQLPSVAWDSVASSADGTKLAAAETYSGIIYTSADSGATWAPANVPVEDWRSVACSADGNEWVAVSFEGLIYTAQTVPVPQLSLARSKTKLALSWTLPSANFVLQQNRDLSTTDWVTLSSAPVLNLTNLQYQITVSPSNGSGFYRLATP